MKRMIMVVLLVVLVVVTAVALAEPTNFTVSWWTVDGGGGSSGGNYTLQGTAGQFDAHTAAIGGQYAISGGFWQPGAVGGENTIFLPLVLR